MIARVDLKAHRYWTALMKGDAVFRGVPMAGVRAAVRGVALAHDLGSWSTAELRAQHADALAAPLASGDVRDWNVTDWYATKA